MMNILNKAKYKLKKLMSIFLAFSMMFTMMPNVAFAASETSVSIKFANYTFSGTNGTISNTAINAQNPDNKYISSGTMSFDASTNTLTLNNVTINAVKAHNGSYEFEYAMRAIDILDTGKNSDGSPKDLTIKLVGTNTITSDYRGAIIHDVNDQGKIIIDGTGSLDITVKKYGEGILANNGLEMNDGTVTIDMQDKYDANNAIDAHDGFVMNGGVLNANSEFHDAITAFKAITINGGIITASSKSRSALSQQPEITAPLFYAKSGDDVASATQVLIYEGSKGYYSDDKYVYINAEIEGVGNHIQVEGIRIHEDNASDVLGDGKVSFDKATNTLTLNNANLVSDKLVDDNNYPGDYMYMPAIYIGDTGKDGENYKDLTIKLEGTNTITTKKDNYEGGISHEISDQGKIIIDGTGSLDITVQRHKTSITADSGLVINNGTITLATTDTLTSGAGTHAVEAVSSFEMNGGILNASSAQEIAILSHNLTVNGGTIISTSGNGEVGFANKPILNAEGIDYEVTAGHSVSEATAIENFNDLTNSYYKNRYVKIVATEGEDHENYGNILVDNQKVLDSNKDNVLAGTANDGKVTYDPNTKTLTLNNVEDIATVNVGAGITVNIDVQGTNTIHHTATVGAGLYVSEGAIVNLTGTGTLNIVSVNHNAVHIGSDGLTRIGHLTVSDSVKLNATSGTNITNLAKEGISASGHLTIQDNAIVKAYGNNTTDIDGSEGVRSFSLSGTDSIITLTDNAQLEGYAGNSTVANPGNGIFATYLNISDNAKVTGTAGTTSKSILGSMYGNGIYVSDTTTQTGGAMIGASKVGYGIYGSDHTMSAGSLVATTEKASKPIAYDDNNIVLSAGAQVLTGDNINGTGATIIDHSVSYSYWNQKAYVKIHYPTAYTISYNANGGNGTQADGAAYADTPFTLATASETTITNTGKILAGWSITSGGDVISSPYTFTGDTEVYAVWADSLAHDIEITKTDGTTVAVTVDNFTNILTDGTVKYEPSTKTLVLNNASIKRIEIISGDILNIKLIGNNTIYDNNTDNNIAAIHADFTPLSFIGDGTLAVTRTQDGWGSAIRTYYDITLSDSVEITAIAQNNSSAIYIGYNDPSHLIINDTAKLVAKSGDAGASDSKFAIEFRSWLGKVKMNGGILEATSGTSSATRAQAIDVYENRQNLHPELKAGSEVWAGDSAPGTKVDDPSTTVYTDNYFVKIDATGTTPTPTTYTITYNSNTGSGTQVDGVARDGVAFNLPATTTFTAPADKQFKGWALESDATEVITSHTFTANDTVYAIWEDAPVVTYTITAMAGEHGTISPNGDILVSEGDDKEFVITPDEGYKIDFIAIDGTRVTTANTYEFKNVTSNTTIIVMFKEIAATTYTLTVTNGSGDGDYEEGEVVDITAASAPTGKQFKNWTSSNGGTFDDKNSECTTFTMPEDNVTITANYESIPKTEITSLSATFAAPVAGETIADLTVTAGDSTKYDVEIIEFKIGAGGDNLIETPSAVILANQEYLYSISFRPKEGYEFSTGITEASVNGKVLHGFGSSYANAQGWNYITSTNETGELTTYELIVTGGHGDGDYEAGEVVDITVAVPTGKQFVNWTSNNGGTFANVNSESTTFIMPENNVTITANYKDITVTSIAVKSTTHKTDYKVDESLDVTDLIITANKSNGYTEDINVTSDMISGFDSSKVATNKTLTITYEGKTTTFDISVAKKDSTPVTTYILTVVGGTGSGDYEEGFGVNIVANVPTGKQFVNWTWDNGTLADENSASTTFTMPSTAATVTANFKDIPVSTYALTVTNGTGSGDYKAGEVINVSANAAPAGQQFVNWTSDSGTFADANSASTTFTMPANVATITANYQAIPVSITGLTISPDTTTVQKGNTQAFAATVNGTGAFNNTVSWSVNGTDSSIDASGLLSVGANETKTSLTVTATANGDSSKTATASITVTEAPITEYTITPSAGSNGSISPTTAQKVAKDGNITFTFTPDSGYEISEVKVDDAVIATATSYTFSNVTANHSINVTFKEVPPTTYEVNVVSGTATPASATEGTSITITATAPESGKQFKEWTGVSGLTFTDGSATTATATFTMPANAVNVTATYEDVPLSTHTITATAGSNGSISPSGAVSVNSGANQAFTFTPDTGYEIGNLTVNGVTEIPTGNSYTITNVIADIAIHIDFVKTYIPTTPSVTGDNQEIIVGTNADVLFKIDANHDDFNRIEYKASTLDPVHYTTASGSINVTLKGSHVSTLPVGTHTYTAIVGNYHVPMNLIVKEAPAATQTYNVTYDDNVSDADITVPSDSTDYNAGDTVKVSTTVPTRDGYIFAGWKDMSTTTAPVTITDGTFTMPDRNVTLSAQWDNDDDLQQQVSFEISYNANGGTGYMDDDWGYYGESVQLAENKFVAPSGKKFVAWAIGSVEGTQVLGGANHTFTEDPDNETGVVQVFAIWENTPSSGSSDLTINPKPNDVTVTPTNEIKASNPNTGDENHLMMYFILSMISLSGAVFFRKRKIS